MKLTEFSILSYFFAEISLVLFTLFVLMGDQFIFEEVDLKNWLDEASQFTSKQMNLRQQVSKDAFLDFLQPPESNKNGALNQAHLLHLKEKNRQNNKIYRERKKNQSQVMRNQIEHIRQQNSILRRKKQCGWCKRSFLANVIISTETDKKSEMPEHNCKHESLMDLQFQKADLRDNMKNKRKSKIWIAMGLLMLILGLTMHGIKGSNNFINQIEIEKKEMISWKREQLTKSSSIQDGYSLDLKIHQTNKSNSHNDLQIKFAQQLKQQQQKEKDKILLSKQFVDKIKEELQDIGYQI